VKKGHIILSVRLISNSPGCFGDVMQVVCLFMDDKSAPCLEAFVESTDEDRRAPISKRKKLSAAEFSGIQAQMAQLQIPAFPDGADGCDGQFWELEFGTEFGGAHYRWWVCPPTGWEPLAQFSEMLFEMAEIYPKYKASAAAAALLHPDRFSEEFGVSD
jgi:hypothetical protein